MKPARTAALLLILAALATDAFAQANCSDPFAAPVVLRNEGRTELLPDLTFRCFGATVPSLMQIQIFFGPSVALTSRAISFDGSTEALAITSAGSVRGTFQATGQSMLFQQLPTPSGDFTVTISNLRVDVTSLSASGIPAAVSELVLVSGFAVNPRVLPSTIAGFVTPGLGAPKTQTTSFAACLNVTPSSGPAFVVPFTENYPTVFKTRSVTGIFQPGDHIRFNTESGIPLGALDNRADFGTRLRVSFSGVPASVRVFLPLTLASANATGATLVSSETGPFNPALALAPSGSNGLPVAPAMAEVQISGGAGQAVYEITSQRPAEIDYFGVPVYLNGLSGALTGAGSPISVAVGFAPDAATIPAFSTTLGLSTTLASPSASCQQLSILPDSIVEGSVGTLYTQPLFSNGAGTATWSIASGVLPAGLTLHPQTGLLSGTPQAGGAFPITISVVDQLLRSTSKTTTLRITAPLTAIVAAVIPPGSQGTPYAERLLTISGGVGAYRLVTQTGNVPGSLDVETGLLRITAPLDSGTFSGTYTIGDATFATVTVTITLTINPVPVLCHSASSPITIMRHEGTTELVGSLSFLCAGSGGLTDVQMELTPSLPFTSEILDADTGASAATLTTVSGTFQGRISKDRSQLLFPRVTIPAGTTSVTISKVRADPTSMTVGAGVPPAVNARVTTPSVVAAIQPTLVGFVQAGIFAPALTDAQRFFSCSPLSASSGPALKIKLNESFASAFKSLASEGGIAGTRLKVLFSNVPANLSLYVPVSLSSGTATIRLTATESGAFSAVTPVLPSAANTLPPSPALAQIAISAGKGEAVYEVTADDPNALESYSVPVYAASSGPVAAQNLPLTVTVSFAPVGSPAIPNFVSFAQPLSGSSFSFCLSPSTLPNAAVGTQYPATTLTASGGTGPYTFSDPLLPPGLAMSSGGLITGTPLIGGADPFSGAGVTVTDSAGVSSRFALQIQHTGPFTILNSSLSSGLISSPYPTVTLKAALGVPPYSWSLASGALPSGLVLDPVNGTISGTPVVSGTFPLTLKVTDANSATTTRAFTLFVAAVLSVRQTIPGATAGSLYAVLLAQGGTPPYDCVLSMSDSYQSLPAGLALNAATCAISGTPSTAGARSIKIVVSDSALPAQSAVRTYRMLVGNPVQVTTRILPAFTSAGATTLSAAGGYPPYGNWTVSSGALPAGFTLNPTTGVLTGGPAAGATFSVTVQDSQGGVSPARILTTVPAIPTVTALSVSAPPHLFGQLVTMTAAVTPVSATGRVTFYDGINVLGTATLVSGKAVLKAPLTTSGKKLFRSYYLGSAGYSASSSNALSRVVTNAPQTGFETPLKTMVGDPVAAATTADFDGDGKSDIAVAVPDGIRVLLGNGNGTFRLTAMSPGLGSDNPFVAADFNGDGKMDLAGTNLPAESVTVMLGRGDGTFDKNSSYDSRISGALATGDFNGDGIVDIATGSSDLLIGNGDGTFYVSKLPSQNIDLTRHIAAGDFNGDGIADLALAEGLFTVKTEILLGSADGTFQSSQVSGANGGLDVGDINLDGFIDIATGSGVLPGTGTGSFGPLMSYGSARGDIALSDFNSDGKPDLMAGTYVSGNSYTVEILPGNGDGTFGLALITVPATGNARVIGDFNGDGRTDFAFFTGTELTLIPGRAYLSITCTPATGPSQTGVAYASSCPAAGGTGPFAWSISTGALPAGLTLNTATGAITGIPSATGAYSFTIKATDSSSPLQSATQSFSGTVTVPVIVVPPPSGGGGIPVGSTLSAAPVDLTFTAVPGTSPAPQTITMTDSAEASSFGTSVTTNQGIGWLSISPTSGSISTKATVSVSVNPAGLGQGTYTGTVNMSTNKGGLASVTVTLRVQGRLTVSPPSLSFHYMLGDAPSPATQSVAVFSDPNGASLTSLASGAPWLAVAGSASTPGNLSVSVNPSSLGAGVYSAAINVSSSTADPVTIPVTLTVVKASLPTLSVTPARQTFTLPRSSPPVSGQFAVLNKGGGTLQFQAGAAVDQGSWLSLSATTGSATASAPALAGFSVDPAGLKPGLYAGRISIQDSGSSAAAVVEVSLSVSEIPQSISLSQRGLTFNALASGLAPPPQTFAVQNAGPGSIAFNVQSDSPWLTAESGPPGTTVRVTASPRGLTPGQYYGSVAISAAEAANSPQSVSVLLNVSATPLVSFSTGALIFTGAAGSRAQQQQISVFNPSNTSLSYRSSVFTPAGGSWLTASSEGILTPGANNIGVQSDFSGLSGGVQSGSITIGLSDGTVQTIHVSAVASGGTAASASFSPRALTACAGTTPGLLVVSIREPLSRALLTAAAAQTVRAQIVDGCGNALSARSGGRAQVTFGNGDGPLDLRDVGSGMWEGTWTPVTAAGSVELLVSAASQGITGLTAGVASVQAAPVTAAASVTGVVNAASGGKAASQIVSPGSYVAIYGERMSTATQAAVTIPLPSTLSGTEIRLGGQLMPLSYGGPNQVNALVPQSLNPNASYQMVVSRGATRSVPTSVTIAALQPGIYTADTSGSGQGVVAIAGTALLAAPAGQQGRPVEAGKDFLSIYCTGLGLVIGPNGEVPPADGAAAGTILYRTKAELQVTLGGVNVPVLFTGLTPSLVALYQINVPVPAEVPRGAAVPLVITATDPVTGAVAVSNTVTVAVQ